MGHSCRLILAVLFSGFVLVSGYNAAEAGVPDPLLSTVPNVIMTPDGSLTYTVNVQSVSGPLDSSFVQLVFSTECQGYVCWCVGQVYLPSIDTYTDASGDADFNISGGGCIAPADLVTDPYCVRVFADGVYLADVGIVSPDRVDPLGVTAPNGWSPGTNCLVAGNDAVAATPWIVNNLYDFCTDLNSDLAINGVDAVILTPSIVNNASCVKAP